MPDRRHGVLWLTLGLTISLLLSTGIGYFALGGEPGAQKRQAQLGFWAPTIPVTPRFGDPAPALAPDDTTGQAPTADGVAKALGAFASDPRFGGKLGLSVIDAETGDALYGLRADTQVTPASTTKIVTAAAALSALGPYHRFATRAVAGSAQGEVVLVGGGDPTLAVGAKATYPGAARLDALAKQVTAAAGGPVTKIVVDSSLFTGPDRGVGWDATVVTDGFVAPVNALTVNGGRLTPGVPSSKPADRTPTPDLFAGQKFAELLGVTAPVSRGTAPEGARELGRVDSAPLQHIVELMLQLSDNVIAESLLRHVAVAKGQPTTFEGGQTAVKAILTDLGLDPAGHGLLDGSGLSRQNRISPQLLTAILHATTGAEHASLRGVLAGLPVAAYSGTLANRFGNSPAAAGEVRAKTGSLEGVSALSGVVVTDGGRQLAFAAITDGVPPGGKSRAEAGLDEIGAALARCGCS
jgi:D-alanyl-D-alanine carboxypeptidase/D-alanyl-D-alanine-endopeptidase (penicillin-binding protein 4)